MDAATRPDAVATAIAQLADAIREVNTAHCVNAATIMVALIEKGILSDDDLHAARMLATSLVAQDQARLRDEHHRETLRELADAWKPKPRRE